MGLARGVPVAKIVPVAPSIRKPPTPVHGVLVDTSILFCEDKAPAVDPDFDKCWDQHPQLGQLELIVPEVVQSELLFQQTTSAVKAREDVIKQTARISDITAGNHHHRLDEATIRDQIGRKFDRWLVSRAGTCVMTPTDRIKWNELIENAVWRKAPFEFDSKNKDNEKGFRDALILETVVDYVQSDSRQVSFLFLCADGLLCNSAKVRLAGDSRFSCLESLEDFASFLKLVDEKLNGVFVRGILSRASERFFSKGDQFCLYNRDKIHNRILTDFKAEFEDPGARMKSGYFSLTPPGVPNTWQPADSGHFWITSAAFANLVRPREYHWTSTITVVRPYLGSDSSYSLFAPAGAPPRQEEWILILPFIVSWKAAVKSDGRFHDLAVTNVELKNRAFRAVTEADRRAYRVFGQSSDKTTAA